MAKSDFARLLLKDYNPNERPMPWKGIKNPYFIWLSEVILQQTRVEQGWNYYLRFREQYPTVKELSQAKDDDVMKLWEGLGYYSRARNLLAAARYVEQELDGQFPDNYRALLKLKGVGPYTAAAIASFAFGEKKAVLDGNVFRVLSRFFEIKTPIDSTKGKKEFDQLATKLIEDADPALFNQAIMDLGAQICLPKNPFCRDCPLQSDCKARLHETYDQLPVKEKKIKKKTRYLNYFLMLDENNNTLIRRRGDKDIWAGLYEIPNIEDQQIIPLSAIKKDKLENNWDTNFPEFDVQLTNQKKHVLTHQNIHAVLFELKFNKLPNIKGFEIISTDNLNKFAFPRLINLLLNA